MKPGYRCSTIQRNVLVPKPNFGPLLLLFGSVDFYLSYVSMREQTMVWMHVKYFKMIKFVEASRLYNASRLLGPLLGRTSPGIRSLGVSQC